MMPPSVSCVTINIPVCCLDDQEDALDFGDILQFFV